MAFTATIASINFQDDNFHVVVNFNDSVTSWSASKTYTFPTGTTQAVAVAQITTDGTAYKAALTANNALQSKVGQVITI